MKNTYFIKHPKTYHDLQNQSSTGTEYPYQVVQTISLDTLDFENFLYGMDADREYLEKYAYLCFDGAVKRCLLIQNRQKVGGILAVPDPESPCYVLWAACEDAE